MEGAGCMERTQHALPHGPANADAERTADDLRKSGINVRRNNEQALTDEALEQLRATPWADEVLATKVRAGSSIRQMGAILRLLKGIRAGRLWEGASKGWRTQHWNDLVSLA